MATVTEDQLGWLSQNPIISVLNDGLSILSEKRDSLGLTNPGTFENISSEVTKGVFLNNLAFTGLRADVTKIFGVSPLFQVSHAFSMGPGGNQSSLPPYTFAALFGNYKTFVQANLDNEGQLSARFNYRWTQSLISKTNVQISPGSGQAMLQLDHDYVGRDFTGSIKSFNPNLLDGGLTGIFIGQYLQSVTKNLSVGLEAIWQRQSLSTSPESQISYGARYQGSGWVGSVGLQGAGALQVTYWRKLAERVEAGVESQLKLADAPMAGIRREGITTIGAKYDFRASTMRAQVDTSGKLGCLLEKRVAPMVTLTFSGEMDHFKNQAKIGLSVSIENASDEVMEKQQSTPAISIPF